jgi:CBS domain containing-hemolysin-like protein/mannitol/fructose-specific phosphotransferase system IIA component
VTLVVLAVALVLLLALNAFFVLAEFSVVKVRPSRVEELHDDGDRRADVVGHIQDHLDEYLSVCQVGITLASVALGMVGKRAADEIMGPGGHDALRYGIATAVSYVVVSGSHIVIGELVPKSIAIRVADRTALWIARPLRFFRYLFLPALWVLTSLANGLLHLLGLRGRADEERHSEDELRIILGNSQERGLMSFHRLLFMENVFDFGDLTVKDAMRPRSAVKCLHADRPWAENLATIRAARFTRYPLIAGDAERPAGFVHLKDLIIRAEPESRDLAAIARRVLTVPEDKRLEDLIMEMQRRRVHVALAVSQGGEWTGYITLEDVIEELVGTIRDEFEDEEPARLADLLVAGRVHLGVEASSTVEAVRAALLRMKPDAVPLPVDEIVRAVAEREKIVSTYLGEGVAIPHARLAGLRQPFVLFVRSEKGIPCRSTPEKATLLFLLLTPTGQPRVHQRLQSTIATMLHESEYVKDRLLTAETPHEVLEAIRAGEQAALD